MPVERSPLKLVEEEQVQNIAIQHEMELPATHIGQHSRSNSSFSFHGFNWEEGMDPETMRKLKGLFRQRSQVEQKLVRIQLQLRDQRNVKLAQLQCTKEKLAAIYTEFSHFHSDVMALIPDEASEEQDDIYFSFEDRHSELSNKIQEMINLATPQQPSNFAVPQPQVIIQQQPLKAPIPTFDGNYANWPKFKAIFQDLMAQSGDSQALKLYHLDKALVGAAAGILDAKIINEGNYQQAWDILTTRYENKRVIVESHIRGLLSLKKMSKPTFKELDSLLSEATGHVESLRYQQQQLLGISEHMVVYLIITALDDATRMAWERTQKRGELPKYQSTISFLRTNCQILEQCESSRALSQPTIINSKPSSNISKTPVPRSNAATTSSSSSHGPCQICGGGHFNYLCPMFKQLTASQMSEKVKSAGLCYNCLRKGHQARECSSAKTCRRCNKRHNTLLHDDNKRNSSQDVKSTGTKQHPEDLNPPAAVHPSTSVVDQPVSSTCTSNHAQAAKTVLLLTAVVQAIDRNNRSHPCRVLLDSGSQVNFVTEEMANRLGMPKTPANVPITGINALRSLARDKVFVKFRSSYEHFHASIECLVTPKVTGTIPSAHINVSHWKLPNGIQLADPEFYKPEKIDLLIGGELFFDILKPDHLNLGDNLPQLRDTRLGWVVAGVINEPFMSHSAIQHANHASIDSVEKLIQQFWKVEEVPNVCPLSPEQQACEAHFQSTYKRDSTGRFVVKLPFKDNLDQLDNCRPMALKRFLMLEKRFERNPELKQQYVEFIKEYEDLGHCREINQAADPPNNATYYLPHHAVLRPSSSTTKCRVVFDASAKSDPSKLSLNDVLQVGPVVQNGIFTITLRFRKYLYAFSADISKMYRQIIMAPPDRRFLRIFWRSERSHPLRVLELNTVTYGTACAPFQATRCLIQLAKEEGAEFPIGAKILTDDFYVDDTLSGANTIEEAIECQRQLKALLAKGGFHIHKWCSNSEEFIRHIPLEDREKQVPLHEYGLNEVIKVLGIVWDPHMDTFLIANLPHSPLPKNQPATKRTVYSEVAKLFDPLGLFAPVIVTAKLLIQQLWKTSTGWDDPIEDDIQQQ